MRRRWLLRLLAAVGLFALTWGAYQGGVLWWSRLELARADRDLAAGEFEQAHERLARLLTIRTDRGEVYYQLGRCLEAAGQPGKALELWAKIEPESPFADRVAQHRDVLLQEYHDRGQFAVLEELLETIRQGTGPEAVAAGQALARLLRFECRFDELRILLREEWTRSPDPFQTLRELWLIDTEPVPLGMVRERLDQAAAEAPDDDRVWLGRGYLAILSGQFDEADRWLSACQARRPRDPAVWRARLDWALATDQPEVVRQALPFLTSPILPPERVLELRAWLVARDAQSGDPILHRDREWQALEDLLAFNPGGFEALERLAELATQAGDWDQAAELRRRKAQVDQAHHRYGTLVRRNDLEPHVKELAHLAETLGRTFEARAFWSHLQNTHTDDSEARAGLARLAHRFHEAADSWTPERLLRELGAVQARRSQASRTEQHPRSATSATLAFTDQAADSGLEFQFENGQSPLRQLPETMSGGVAVLDFDGDGWLDVYVVQGGRFPPEYHTSQSSDRLFRNRGDGTFEDVTQTSGLAEFARGYGHGVTVADYDNDGWPDLFVTRWRGYALYRNNGDGTFSDVTARVGLAGDQDWPTSAAFADFNSNGYLDLYVCHYLAWEASNPRPCRDEPSGAYTYCDPRLFDALPDRLYRNVGGRFVDVTTEAGITAPNGRGLGVVAADLDGDGHVDLYVANDTTANFFYRNLGAMRFEEIGHESGLAGNAEGGYQAGMGIALGDFDGDGRPDLAVTNFQGEGTTFYHNLGGGMFCDRSSAMGLMAASRHWLGFGIAFLDADNDGWLDLATTYGHVNDYRPTFPYAMPSQLLRGDGGGRLTDWRAGADDPWNVLRVGRGLAVGDLNNDGRVDLLILSQDQPLAYLQNRTDGGHFVTLRLQGTDSNRDGIGARVTVRAGGRDQVAQRFGGGSYQSASDPRLHFGLGDVNRLDSVEVVWPSGQIDRYCDLQADTGYLLRERSAQPFPLQGF